MLKNNNRKEKRKGIRVLSDEKMLFLLKDNGIGFYAYNSWTKFGKVNLSALLRSALKDFESYQDLSHQFFSDWTLRIVKWKDKDITQFKRIMFKEFEYWVRWHHRKKWLQYVTPVSKEYLESIPQTQENKMQTQRMEAVIDYCESTATEEEKFIIDYLMMDNKTKNSFWSYSKNGTKSNDRRSITLPTGKSYSKQTFYNKINLLKTKLSAFVNAALETK